MSGLFSDKNPFLEYDRFLNYLHRGDLIEIHRGKYRHWALCERIQNDSVWCFHVTHVPNFKIERDNRPKYEACIRYQPLRDILLNSRRVLSKCRVNNQVAKAEQLMKKEGINTPPNINVIIDQLHGVIDHIVEYDPKDKNCEHYITQWKYGIGFSSHSKTYHKLIGAGIGTSAFLGAGTYFAAAGLGAAGFTSSGIVGGSAAAAWQSSIGSVTAGSTFATLQSLGATGTIATVGSAALGFTLPVLVLGGGYWCYRSLQPGLCEEYTENK